MKRFLVSLFIILSVAGLVANIQPAAAVTGDCDNNAILWCGVFSVSELQRNTTSNGNVVNIFAHFGINKADMNGLVIGSVRKDGAVIVNGKVVATNAVTAGRQNMPGSTAVPSLGIFERPPSVSFRSNELKAFVKMVNGQFKWAVIQTCGNPVRAVAKPTPKPPVQPPKPPVQPPKPPKPPVKPPKPPVEQPKKPDVSITKSVDKTTVKVNENFTYTLTVKNTGEVALVNAKVTDTAPTGVEFTASANTSTTQFMVTIPLLNVGQSISYTIMAHATQQLAGDIVNTACVDAVEIPGTNDDCADAKNRMEGQVLPAVTPPVATPVDQPKPEVLTVTGPEAVFGMGASTSAAVYAGSMMHRRLRSKFLK
jgi:uncharacterized repeat protein (TIGR01451 family)